jgi:HEPN domain-containing protein
VSVAADHLDQARRNRALAEQLLALSASDPTTVQWTVIAAFYCAVHCMQAHLVTLGHDPVTHVERGALIDLPSSGIPADVRRSYRWLKQRSEAARYRLAVFDPLFVRTSMLDTHLARVTQFVGL